MNRYGSERVRKGVRHFIAGKAISSLAGVAALVLVVRGLSIEAFADYSVLLALIEVLGALSGFGVVHALLRFVPELYGAHYRQALSRFVWGAMGIRTALLMLFIAIAYALTGRVAGLVGLEGAETAYAAFLVVVLIRATVHLVSQVLESTLHQSYAQAGFTLATVARLGGVGYLTINGSMDLVSIIWIEAVSELIGLGVMLVGVSRVVNQAATEAVPGDDGNWMSTNLGRVVRFGLSGYLQHILILPYGGHTNRLVGGHFLDSHATAAFGFAQSLYEYARRYLPAQLLIGLIRPVVLDRFVRTRDFAAANRTLATVFKVNALLLGPALVYLPVAGVETLLFVSGDKYGPRASPMLFAMCIMLLLETVRMQLEVLTQAVERYENLVPANLLLSLSVIPAAALLSVLGPIAFPIANTLGLVVSNYWVVRKLGSQGYRYTYDRPALFRIAGLVLFGMACGWLVKWFTGLWWLGGAAAVTGYLLAFVVFGRADIDELRRILAKGGKEKAARSGSQEGLRDSVAPPVSTMRPSIQSVLRREIFLDVGGGSEDAVLVVGTGRSGTTWVGDVIAAATRSRIVFEPFIWGRDDRLLFAGRYRFSHLTGRLNYSLYLPDDAGRGDQYLGDVERVLAGRVRGFWVNQEIAPKVYRKRVIKDIRANLMLPWLARNWPALRIVYLVRNPAKVIDSMIERSCEGWGFDWSQEDAMSQPGLMRDYLTPFRDLIENSETLVERLAMRWCIENYVPLQHLHEMGNVMLVRYEDLVRDRDLWEKIRVHIGCAAAHGEDFLRSVDKPSHTSSSCSKQAREGAAKGYLHLDEADLATIRHYAERFGLVRYVDDVS